MMSQTCHQLTSLKSIPELLENEGKSVPEFVIEIIGGYGM